MRETFRLDLSQSWEAIDIQTGAGVVIPKGSHKAVRMLHRTNRDQKEEPWLVVTVQHNGKPVSAGLCEAYWRQWECDHVPEFRVTTEEWKENAPPSPRNVISVEYENRRNDETLLCCSHSDSDFGAAGGAMGFSDSRNPAVAGWQA